MNCGLKKNKWALFSWEEQIELFSIGGDIVRKVDVFLKHCGLRRLSAVEVSGWIGLMEDGVGTPEGDASGTVAGGMMDRMEEWLNGDVCYLAYSEPRTEEEKRMVMGISIEELAAVVEEKMGWMEKDKTLLVLKEKEICIGKKRYRLPDVMMGNMCFEQWLHAHSWFRMYVRGARKYKEIVEKWDMEEDEMHDMPSNWTENKRQEFKGDMERASVIAEELKKAQCGFLACLVKPYVWHWQSAYPWLVKEDMWVSKDEERVQEEMMKSAPEWLFGMLHKWWEDTIERFRGRKMFWEIFSDGKTEEDSSGTGADDEIANWVSEMGTINLVREKGNYTTTDDVMREPVPVVLKLMNDVVKENREIKKEMDKAKR